MSSHPYSLIPNSVTTSSEEMDVDPDTSMLSSTSDNISESAPSTSGLSSVFTSHQDDVSTTPTSRHVSSELPGDNVQNHAQAQAGAQAHLPQNGNGGTAVAAAAQTRARRIKLLREEMQSLTIEAQRQFQDQPRHTQLALTGQTKQIFEGWEGHGSAARLSWDIWRFLSAREDVRKHVEEGEGDMGGEMNGGGLVFWSFEEGVERKSGVGANNKEHGNGEGSGWVDNDHDGMETEVELETPKKSVKMHPNRNFRVNAEMTAWSSGSGSASSSFNNSNSDRTDETSTAEDSPPVAPDVDTQCTDRIYLSLPQSSPSFPRPKPPQSLSPPPSYTHDPTSTLILRSLPFAPADINLSFPSYTNFPGTPTTYLTHMNNIIKSHNVQANAMLHHHDTKYLCPELNTPGDVRRLEHGYVILRAGIGEIIRDRVSEMFGEERRDWLGLSTETRSLLKEIYDSRELGTGVKSASRGVSGLKRKKGVSGEGSCIDVYRLLILMMMLLSAMRPGVWLGKRKLNATEEVMVARLSRVPIPGVRAFWEERDRERMAVKAMRVWVGAREIERGRRSREEGRYWGTEGNEEEDERRERRACGDGKRDLDWVASDAYKDV